MRLPDASTSSPNALYLFGQAELGVRGMEVFSEDQIVSNEVLANYGVDWDFNGDRRAMDHFLENNPADWDEHNPFAATFTIPDHTNEVTVEAPDRPLSQVQVDVLEDFLVPYRQTTLGGDMLARKLLWQVALEKCNFLLS